MADEDVPRRDDEHAIQIALFRYGVIAELVERRDTLGPGETVALVREIAGQSFWCPGRGSVRVAERTVYAWARAYRCGGIEALRPAMRRDRGTRRVLSDRVLERAIELRREQPRRWTSTLIDLLSREGTLGQEPGFHRATLDRHLDRLGMSRRRLHAEQSPPTIKMRFERFGDLWVGDYHHGPPVRAPDGRTTTAKLGAFLDHTTRYPVADRWYLAEDLASLRDTLLRALLRWGAPRKAYVDRGAVYRAEQLAYSLARIDCHLVHSRPYYSQGRGVIERWWQLSQAFEAEIAIRAELLTIHELNRLWEAWRTERYCHVTHSELGRTPAEAVAELTPRPIEPATARLLFLVRAHRTVGKKDACVAVEHRRFLCDRTLRRRRVEVRFDPNDLSSVEIFRDGKRVQTAYPQPLNATAEPPATPIEPPAPSVDYLELVRRDYDQRLIEHARPLAYAELHLEPSFDAERFRTCVAELAGLASSAATRRELFAFWETFGPLPEDLCRIATEHAVRLNGRGRHPRVYLHAIRTLALAHWKHPPKEAPS